ncbi:MAG: ion channel [Alistipes sp.]
MLCGIDFDLLKVSIGTKEVFMIRTAAVYATLRHTLNMLTLIGGMVLLTALSWEIIMGDHLCFSRGYLSIQLIVCLFFLSDFFLRWRMSDRRVRFVVRNVLFLLLSIPYLNILEATHADLTRDWMLLIGIMPLARAFLALYVVVRWLVSSRVQQLLTAYLFTVIVSTYIAALIFYDYEVLVNSRLHGFGNALWWAGMSVTTVGAEIYPLTAVGKIMAVLLPLMGMMMLPIFTAYVVQQYTHKEKSDK